MKAAICDIEIAIPKRVLDNAQLAEAFPKWDMDLVATRTGVRARRIAADDETALDLGEAACTALFERCPTLRDDVDILLFCTQTPDHPIPANACILHGRLGLRDRVGALDINLACSGFGYALGLARSLVESGGARNALIITADTYSKLVHARDRAVRPLFGDGAAATWIGPGDGASFVEDVMWGTRGAGYQAFCVPAGGFRTPRSPATCIETEDVSNNVRTPEHIHMKGKELLKFTSGIVPDQIRALLDKNDVRADDVALFVFHQASELVLDTLACRLNLRQEQVFRNLADVGNTVSASIPMALHAARASGALNKGDRVVVSGFGAGLSWASALLRF